MISGEERERERASFLASAKEENTQNFRKTRHFIGVEGTKSGEGETWIADTGQNLQQNCSLHHYQEHQEQGQLLQSQHFLTQPQQQQEQKGQQWLKIGICKGTCTRTQGPDPQVSNCLKTLHDLLNKKAYLYQCHVTCESMSSPMRKGRKMSGYLGMKRNPAEVVEFFFIENYLRLMSEIRDLLDQLVS